MHLHIDYLHRSHGRRCGDVVRGQRLGGGCRCGCRSIARVRRRRFGGQRGRRRRCEQNHLIDGAHTVVQWKCEADLVAFDGRYVEAVFLQGAVCVCACVRVCVPDGDGCVHQANGMKRKVVRRKYYALEKPHKHTCDVPDDPFVSLLPLLRFSSFV